MKKLFFISVALVVTGLSSFSCKKSKAEDLLQIATPTVESTSNGATFLKSAWVTEFMVRTWIGSDGMTPTKAEYQLGVSIPADSFDLYIPQSIKFIPGATGGNSTAIPYTKLSAGAYTGMINFAVLDSSGNYLDAASGLNAAGNGRLGTEGVNITYQMTFSPNVIVDQSGMVKIPKGTIGRVDITIFITEPGTNEVKGKYQIGVLSINASKTPVASKITAWPNLFKTQLQNPAFN
jgi:hypothetical protein